MTILKRHRKPKSLLRLFFAIGVCLLVMLLWPASYFWSEELDLLVGRHRIELKCGPGWIWVESFSGTQNLDRPRFGNHLLRLDATARGKLAYPRIYSGPDDRQFYFPLWMLSVSMSVVAAAMVISDFRRRRNFRPGSCANCGYDLRATPDRCPECGMDVSG